MRAHRRRRINYRRTVLYLKPFYGIGIVARPYLRAVVKHSGVKSSAAARAALEQQMRKSGEQPLEQLVNTEHISVRDLALAVGRQKLAADLCQIAVEIPFDIFDIRRRKYLIHLIEYVVSHVLARHIENILVPPYRTLAPLGVQAPVGMRAVKIAVR